MLWDINYTRIERYEGGKIISVKGKGIIVIWLGMQNPHLDITLTYPWWNIRNGKNRKTIRARRYASGVYKKWRVLKTKRIKSKAASIQGANDEVAYDFRI